MIPYYREVEYLEDFPLYLKKKEVDTEGLKGKVFVHKLHYMK